ncbi:MAG TPA: DUF5671 domain-containing protein [Luteimonas sp.]|nr:DUF5671 domain-containing protein [Luteimonas sp.]
MPSASTDLDRFVRDALTHGQSRQSIADALAQAGWTHGQTSGVLDGYADLAFPVPVPRPRASLSAREAFAYLVLFAALYFSAWHLGSLAFDLVDRAWPDVAVDGIFHGGSDSGIRFSIAALLIAFPVFAFVARRVARDVARHPIQRLSPVRRWLTYLTLFIATTVLVGDMTTLLYHVLGGELTVRFALKVGVVAFIAGGIFGWYLWDLRREEGGA